MERFSRRKLAVVVGAALLPCAELALAAVPTVVLTSSPASDFTNPTVVEVGDEVTFKIESTYATGVSGNLSSIHFCRRVGTAIDIDVDACQVVASNITSGSRTDYVIKSFGPASADAEGKEAMYYVYALDDSGDRSAYSRAKIAWRADAVVSTMSLLKSEIASGTSTNQKSIWVEAGDYNGNIDISDKQYVTLVGAEGARILGSGTTSNVIKISDSKGIRFGGFTIGEDVPANGETGWGLIRGNYGIYVRGQSAGAGSKIVVEENKVRLTAGSGIKVEGATYVEVRNNVVEKTNAGEAFMYYALGQRDEVTVNNWLIDAFTTTDGVRRMSYRTSRNSDNTPGDDVANDCDEAASFREKAPGGLFRPSHEMISVAKENLGTKTNPVWKKSSDVNVVGNEVFNGNWTINRVCVVGKEGIDVKAGSSDSDIEFNYVHDLEKLGIYVDAYKDIQTNNKVVGNIVHNAKHGIALSAEDEGGSETDLTAYLENVLVANNRVYANDGDGIIVTSNGSLSGGNRLRKNIKILNNTSVGNGDDGIDIATENAKLVYVANNLVSNNVGKQVRYVAGFDSGTQYISQSNLAWKTGKDCTTGDLGNGIGSGLVCANPLFESGDGYSVQYSSPATNKALEGWIAIDGIGFRVDSLVKQDATGAQRPASYDIGAMERMDK